MFSKEQIEKWTNEAKQGHADAQYNLGLYYYHGSGNDKYEKAAEWFSKAAKQGYADAQDYMDLCCEKNPHIITKVYPDAVGAVAKMAEQGRAEAQLYLGGCYFEGVGVEKDNNKAAYWYAKSAEQGNLEAQFLLGNCFFNGVGLVKDESEAVQWWEKAAEKGHFEAQFLLGNSFLDGLGVKQDESKATYWWNKAAEQGHANSQYGLGMCYYWGIGVEKDKKKAVELAEKAAAQGHEEAKQSLEKIKDGLDLTLQKNTLVVDELIKLAKEGDFLAGMVLDHIDTELQSDYVKKRIEKILMMDEQEKTKSIATQAKKNNLGHDFNFDGGEILSRIGAAWFVSYAYYNHIDNNHLNWQSGITDNSLKSRRSKYNNSTEHHKLWLNEVLKMEQLGKHKNSVNLNALQIKDMARKVLLNDNGADN